MATQYMYAPSHSYGHQGVQAHDSSGQNGSFSFKKRFEHIDWRKIASIDIDQISRTLDFNALQENIMNLTFCNIESELDMRMVDPNFVKLFKLAQFTIEYLLHSQDYLAGVVAASEEKVKATEQEMLKLKNEMEKQKEELIEIKKESHKRKKLLIAQQQMIHAGSDSYNKCPFCAKAFLNSSFLQAHIFRRHHEYSSKGSSTEAHGSSGGTISKTLEIELHEIKERLQMTEAALKEEKRANRSLRNSLKDGDHNISSEVYQERLQYEEQQREMEEMRHKYEKEIQDLNLKQQATERALIDMRQGRRSNIGNLEDDDDDMDPRLVNKQSKEVLELQEQLHVMRNQMDKQNKKWSKKINEMSDTRNQLMNALEKTDKELLASKKIQSPEKDQQHTQNEDILRKSREQEQLLSMLEEEMERDAEKNRLIEAKKREERQKKEEREREEERHRTVKTKSETIVETIVNKRTRTQGLQSSLSPQVRRSTSPARMEPSDDEDESEMLTGTGTGSFLTSQKGTGTLQSTGGSNINRTLNTGDYLKHLRSNPTLDLLKKEFLAQLDEKLEKIGVDPKQPGITDFFASLFNK
ncbi:cilium assembly protein DZIP1 [Patella vulgata]|uniref:cilium assembly protein DZIP1 n=1 Tax=Patella vulgata TaxID=6465 RepID=UPI0024A9B72D|nr:cilium assembly protein DZIP1 [Patella vulgata]